MKFGLVRVKTMEEMFGTKFLKIMIVFIKKKMVKNTLSLQELYGLQILTTAGVNAVRLKADIEQAIARLPQVQGVDGDVQPSNEFVRTLNLCDKIAQ